MKKYLGKFAKYADDVAILIPVIGLWVWFTAWAWKHAIAALTSGG